jgi:hypothetical protein
MAKKIDKKELIRTLAEEFNDLNEEALWLGDHPTWEEQSNHYAKRAVFNKKLYELWKEW